METITIEKSWHKVTDKWAATKNQIDYLRHLCAKSNVEFPFPSDTNAMRSLTCEAASTAIEALKTGDTIEFE